MLTNHTSPTRNILDNEISGDTQAITTANGTTTQIAAPGAGRRIVVTALSLVDTSAGAHTCNLLSASTNKGNLVLPASGGQVLANVPIRCGENEAFHTTDTAAATGTVAYSIVPS